MQDLLGILCEDATTHGACCHKCALFNTILRMILGYQKLCWPDLPLPRTDRDKVQHKINHHRVGCRYMIITISLLIAVHIRIHPLVFKLYTICLATPCYLVLQPWARLLHCSTETVLRCLGSNISKRLAVSNIKLASLTLCMGCIKRY